MKAVSLFAVLLFARILVLFGRDVPLSWWSPVAYVWQDLLIVLVFAVVDRITARRPWISWMVYSATVLYVAINLPLFRLLSSPMTMPMFRATRGALADSIRHHLTAENFLLIGSMLGAAVMLPLILRRVKLPTPVAFGLVVLSATVVACGPAAGSRVETGGLHRNVFIAMLDTAFPRVAAQRTQNGDWRKSPLPIADPVSVEGADGLSRFKGAAKGRNVVLILLESTGAQYLKPYGAMEDPMPNLTALAHQSILFENAYSVYPESIKGLFSVLCSRYPAMDTRPEIYADVGTSAIAERLAAAGYRTALFHSGRFLYLGMEEIVRHRGFQTLEDAGDIGGNHESSFGVDEPAAVQRMLNWIDSRADGKKFFIAYLPVAGHHPYATPAPGPFPGTTEMDRYRNALHYGDASLGELFDGLKRRGLFDNTLFVIFGDHSEAFGQHEGNYGHTQFIYEENVRVPWFIVAPGLVHEPIRARRAASLIDTAPTILDLVGLPIPKEYQGSSLLESRSPMALFYTDYSLGFLGLRDGPWKFIYELENGRSKLFDLVTDPAETRNLAGQHAARVKAYREHLQRWAAAQRDLVLHPESYPAYSRR